jgi:hypothetical protein
VLKSTCILKMVHSLFLSLDMIFFLRSHLFNTIHTIFAHYVHEPLHCICLATLRNQQFRMLLY